MAGDHAWIALDQTVERGGAAALSVGRQEYKVAWSTSQALRLIGEAVSRLVKQGPE